MGRLEISCINPGCTWTGIAKEYVHHYNMCRYILIKCVCDVQIPKRDIEQHKTRDCPLREVPVEFCDGLTVFRGMDHHNAICRLLPVSCPNGCGQTMTRRDIEGHVQYGGCPQMSCPFGCQATGDDHATSEVVQHGNILLADVSELQDKINSMVNRQSPAYERISARLDNIEGELVKMEETIQKSGSIVDRENRSNRQLKNTRNTTNGNKPSRAANRDATDDMTVITVMSERHVIIDGLVSVLKREVEQLTQDRSNLVQKRQGNAELLERVRTRAVGIERGIPLKETAMAEQDLRLCELETTSFDGTLVYVITDVARRRQEAVRGRKPSIYSTPFYTARAGYKMCVRIYLNGDGMGKGTHISLFFVIMRGQYDAILPWPFKQKVTLMLLDQNNREHVIDAFRPDPSSSSFRRPQSAMNVASGVPLFCPLSRLEDRRFAYIKEDTMFFKVIVDCDGI